MCIPNLVTGFINLGIDMGTAVADQEADDKALKRTHQDLMIERTAARRQEVDARVKGALTAGQSRMAGTDVTGQQRIAFGAAGLDINSGTAAQLQRSSEMTAELDAATARNNARREALGFKQVQHKLDVKWEQEAAAHAQRRTARYVGLVKSGLNVAGGAGGSALGGGK